ncbi:MAG: hypothetical protein DMG41_33575 [Acidobacteria bacterium]|nr:MAG: hypothetical protein AUH13_24520 [Acidobacteria bacterium 13_2_20CM_58_27]PYT82289.1 MAG: hypothetical protein DMG41_33575 [Acidobacteriota bacterium]
MWNRPETTSPRTPLYVKLDSREIYRGMLIKEEMDVGWRQFSIQNGDLGSVDTSAYTRFANIGK